MDRQIEDNEEQIRKVGQQLLVSCRPDLVEAEGLVVTDCTFLFEVVDKNMSAHVMTLTSMRRRPWLRFGMIVPEAVLSLAAILANVKED